MQKYIITISIGIILIAGLVYIFQTSLMLKEEGAKNLGEKSLGQAPQFTLSDYKNKQISSLDFKGKILVVNSWAVWCPFCRNELEDFANIQEEFSDDIVVIAIDRAESLKKAKEFTDSVGVSDRIIFLLDPKDSFYKSIGGFSMPETIFVNKQGEIIVHKRGPMKLEEMREKVLLMLKNGTL